MADNVKAYVCTCGKKFKTHHAKASHMRDAAIHRPSQQNKQEVTSESSRAHKRDQTVDPADKWPDLSVKKPPFPTQNPQTFTNNGISLAHPKKVIIRTPMEVGLQI